jgi:hypothetical protein
MAWALCSGSVIAISESGSAALVKENAVALSLTLTPQNLQTLDEAHPPHRHTKGILAFCEAADITGQRTFRNAVIDDLESLVWVISRPCEKSVRCPLFP